MRHLNSCDNDYKKNGKGYPFMLFQSSEYHRMMAPEQK